MRIWLLIFVMLLAGCAGQAPVVKPEAPKLVDRVEPIAISLPQQYRFSAYPDYLSPLLENLTQESVYTLINPGLLNGQYQFSHEVTSTDPRKTVYAYRNDGGQWGYVTTGIGRNPVANAFIVEKPALGLAYALVLKQLKVCFVTQANGVPQWSGAKWRFPSQPGYFECTGMTNKNIFRLGTGMPLALGVYYGEKDTVFLFRTQGQLQQVLWALKRQFPTIVIPVIDR